jgi:hypothetical protein
MEPIFRIVNQLFCKQEKKYTFFNEGYFVKFQLTNPKSQAEAVLYFSYLTI